MKRRSIRVSISVRSVPMKNKPFTPNKLRLEREHAAAKRRDEAVPEAHRDANRGQPLRPQRRRGGREPEGARDNESTAADHLARHAALAGRVANFVGHTDARNIPY